MFNTFLWHHGDKKISNGNILSFVQLWFWGKEKPFFWTKFWTKPSFLNTTIKHGHFFFPLYFQVPPQPKQLTIKWSWRNSDHLNESIICSHIPSEFQSPNYPQLLISTMFKDEFYWRDILFNTIRSLQELSSWLVGHLHLHF